MTGTTTTTTTTTSTTTTTNKNHFCNYYSLIDSYQHLNLINVVRSKTRLLFLIKLIY